MLKEEFEKLINKEIDNKEYEIINLVYTFHLLFKNKTKQDIAKLYKEFGIEIFIELYPTAKKFEEFDKQRNELLKQIEIIDNNENNYFDNKMIDIKNNMVKNNY